MKKIESSIKISVLLPIFAFALGLVAALSKRAANYTDYYSAGYYVGKYYLDKRKSRAEED